MPKSQKFTIIISQFQFQKKKKDSEGRVTSICQKRAVLIANKGVYLDLHL